MSKLPKSPISTGSTLNSDRDDAAMLLTESERTTR